MTNDDYDESDNPHARWCVQDHRDVDPEIECANCEHCDPEDGSCLLAVRYGRRLRERPYVPKQTTRGRGGGRSARLRKAPLPFGRMTPGRRDFVLDSRHHEVPVRFTQSPAATPEPMAGIPAGGHAHEVPYDDGARDLLDAAEQAIEQALEFPDRLPDELRQVEAAIEGDQLEVVEHDIERNAQRHIAPGVPDAWPCAADPLANAVPTVALPDPLDPGAGATP